MRAFGHLFLLAALDLARSADDAAARRQAVDDDALTASVSREDIARAWRRWAESEPPQPRIARRGLALPAPRSEI